MERLIDLSMKGAFLADILRYHFMPGVWTLADIPEGYHRRFKM